MPILVATDFSDDSDRAVADAARFAAVRNTPLTILHSLEDLAHGASWRPAVPREMREEYAGRARDRMQTQFEEGTTAPERPSEVNYHVEFERAAEGITRALEDGDFELVVLGATGKNAVEDLLLGSTPDEIARRSEVPVMVVPGDAASPPYERILAPVDFTDCSENSLRHAASLARENDADLHIVHAYTFASATEAGPYPSSYPSQMIENLEELRAEQFDQLLDAVDLEGITWERREIVGIPNRVIVDAVHDVGAELVVMGTHGRRGFERLFLGSTASKVLRNMPCTVLTVRS